MKDDSNGRLLSYKDYLHLDSLLNAQHRKSAEAKQPVHDEMLFIVVHQVYELWFKEILFELDSVLQLFSKQRLSENCVGLVVDRLERVTKIQQLLIEQLRVLETMTPMDFLDFRDFLFPASGVQSQQFRLFEIKLGLKSNMRTNEAGYCYRESLQKDDLNLIAAAEEAPSLLQLMDRWLARTPFLRFRGFDFFASYRESVEAILDKDHQRIKNNPSLNETRRKSELQAWQETKENFDALFDKSKHEALLETRQRQLSYEAMHAALLIMLYRDQPILHMPHKLITAVMDIDELLTAWRYRHALMVHRMLGTKIGTGGSSGHAYLLAASQKHRIFTDFSNLATLLVKRSALPTLPKETLDNLGFRYTENSEAV